MPVAEIAAAISSLSASMNIAKGVASLRDEVALLAVSNQLQSKIAEAISKVIEAQQAQMAQLDRIKALETEVAELKAWGDEAARYELKQIGRGSVAYMLKPECRGTQAAHWLCPTCFDGRKKGYFQPQVNSGQFGAPWECVLCKAKIVTLIGAKPEWVA